MDRNVDGVHETRWKGSAPLLGGGVTRGLGLERGVLDFVSLLFKLFFKLLPVKFCASVFPHSLNSVSFSFYFTDELLNCFLCFIFVLQRYCPAVTAEVVSHYDKESGSTLNNGQCLEFFLLLLLF
jgi:hypothetical protein